MNKENILIFNPRFNLESIDPQVSIFSEALTYASRVRDRLAKIILFVDTPGGNREYKSLFLPGQNKKRIGGYHTLGQFIPQISGHYQDHMQSFALSDIHVLTETYVRSRIKGKDTRKCTCSEIGKRSIQWILEENKDDSLRIFSHSGDEDIFWHIHDALRGIEGSEKSRIQWQEQGGALQKIP